jgi:hypothetical protein
MVTPTTAAWSPYWTTQAKTHDKGAPLIDPADWFDTPKSIVLAILRVLWWLAWDFCIQTVGWSIGWCVLRLLSLGRYPEERLGGVDGAAPGTAVLVEIIGLGVLAAGIWGLAGALP